MLLVCYSSIVSDSFHLLLSGSSSSSSPGRPVECGSSAATTSSNALPCRLRLREVVLEFRDRRKAARRRSESCEPPVDSDELRYFMPSAGPADASAILPLLALLNMPRGIRWPREPVEYLACLLARLAECSVLGDLLA